MGKVDNLNIWISTAYNVKNSSTPENCMSKCLIIANCLSMCIKAKDTSHSVNLIELITAVNQ